MLDHAQNLEFEEAAALRSGDTATRSSHRINRKTKRKTLGNGLQIRKNWSLGSTQTYNGEPEFEDHAQLVERYLDMVEVGGSNPPGLNLSPYYRAQDEA